MTTLVSAILSRRMLVCVLTGFSSGLPLYVGRQLMPAWLDVSGVDLSTIGIFGLLGLPYTLKFLWAPLLDRFTLPALGRRRGWALLLQGLLLGCLAGYAALDPAASLGTIAALTGVVAFLSASQDIVLDAWRREMLPDAELGLGNSLFVNGYRLAALVPGSLALFLADRLPWWKVHLVVATFMVIGIAATALSPEAPPPKGRPRTLAEAVWEPLRSFFFVRGARRALTILAFLLFYKLGDTMATALLTPFYLDIGFTLTEIATVAKFAALGAAVIGGLGGGALMLRIGINRALWLFGGVQFTSILGFVGLALLGPSKTALFAAVSFEYLGVGLGTAAFVAFIARETDKRYTAFQLALLTSLAGVPATIVASSAGMLAEATGWPVFFACCTALAVPGLLMLPRVAPWNSDAGGS
ncbi:MAG: MFS transporter [Myxococcota bacterium]|nr:MFS transporter [Myxococcota bacterium]